MVGPTFLPNLRENCAFIHLGHYSSASHVPGSFSTYAWFLGLGLAANTCETVTAANKGSYFKGKSLKTGLAHHVGLAIYQI